MPTFHFLTTASKFSTKQSVESVVSERVYTTGEVAKLVGVNFRTVIRWIDRGELAGYKLPGRGDHRVQKSSLIDFIHKHGMPMPDALVPKQTALSVLVVDDEAPMANAIARVFKRAGWQVHVAVDGFQAGMLLVQHRPMLMTLDLRMPGMDGFKVLEIVRNQFSPAELKIMVISAEDKASLALAVKRGADVFVEKPFDNEFLLEQAKRLLSIA